MQRDKRKGIWHLVGAVVERAGFRRGSCSAFRSGQNMVQLPAELGDIASHLQLRYLPGAYPMQPRTLMLRPLAEYTKMPDGTRSEFWPPR
jgi:hypothetical protein